MSLFQIFRFYQIIDNQILIISMSLRLLAFLIFGLLVLGIIQHDRAIRSITKHQPKSPVKLSSDPTVRPYYTTGPIRNVELPKVSFFDLISRKKIDNFIFNHYNHYKLEFTFIDLGYASQFMFSFFSVEQHPYRITERLGFDLSQKMLDGSLNLDLVKRNFRLRVRQYIDHEKDETITTFNVSFYRTQSSVNANLSHVLRNKECLTSIRSSNIISHKCYGGIGSGKVKIEQVIKQNEDRKKHTNMMNPTLNLTRTAYDGLRGSGFYWNWVWGQMSGFSKIQFYERNHTIPIEHWIGLNFGHLFGQGQDFVFIDGKIIPIQGLTYQFNEKVRKNTNITFKATHPKFEANFTVSEVNHNLDDMGILKLDLVKAQGEWAGWILNEEGKNYTFYQISGLIESSYSLF